MAIHMLVSDTIWPPIKDSVDYLRAHRRQAPPTLAAGLNFSIILGSACLLEGALEDSLRALLRHQRAVFSRVEIPDFETRRAMNTYFTRIEDDVGQRIGKAIGASGYDDVFKVLTGERLSRMSGVVSLWESVTVLFNFRNVLAHGRRVFARRIADKRELDDEGNDRVVSWIDEFSGSYRVVEDYLRKQGLLASAFIEASAADAYLTDPVADHFSLLPHRVARGISASLSGAQKAAHDETVAGLLVPEAM